MLRDRNDVRAANLGNSDLVLVGRVEVDMVRPDTGGDAKLELGSLLDEVRSEVAGVERGGDEDLGVGEVLLESTLGALLVARNLSNIESIDGSLA